MGTRIKACGLALVLLLATTACSSDGDSTDSIKIPSSAGTFEGENHQDVVDDLQEAGFTNIETKALGDLVTGWLKKDGSVAEVSVDGNSSYSTDTRFLRNIEIVVSYHSFPADEAEASDSSATTAPPEADAELAPVPVVRPVGDAEARWLEIMMISKPLDLLTQDGYDYYAPLHLIQPGWGGATDSYLRITVQEQLDAEQVKRLGINVLNLIGPDFPDIQGVVFTDSTGLDHNFFRGDAPGADLGL